VEIAPQMSGGGQQRGLRSGTTPMPLAVGLGEAAMIATQEMDNDLAHVTRLSEIFLSHVQEALPGVTLNGDRIKRYPGNLNLMFRGISGARLLLGLKKLAVSSGSACA